MATNAQVLPAIKSRVGAIPGIAWIMGLAALLRFVNLGQENLWYDESFTVLLAKLPLANLLTAIRGDVHPPLWYFLEALNIRVLGVSEIALRWPSAVFGCIAVWQVYKLAYRLGCYEKTARIAALFCAVLPSMLYYSQEARMYALLTCAVIWMIQAGLDRRWGHFIVAGIIAAYLQNLGVAYVFCIGLAMFTLPRQRIRVALSLAGIVVAWLPWAAWGISHQMAQMSQGFWMPPLTIGGSLWPLTSMSMGWRMADQFQIHVYGAAIAITLLSLLLSRRWLLTKRGITLISPMGGMPVLVAVVSMVWRNVYLHRALLPSIALLMIVWAYGLDQLSKPNKLIALAVLCPALAIGMIAHYFPINSRADIANWIEPVKQEWKQGDVIYHVALDSAILSQVYSQGYPYYLLPESNDLSQSLTDETKQAIGFPMLKFDGLLTQGYRRAYYFWIDSPMVSRGELAETARIKAEYSYRVIQDSRGSTVSSGIWLVDLNSKDVF